MRVTGRVRKNQSRRKKGARVGAVIGHSEVGSRLCWAPETPRGMVPDRALYEISASGQRQCRSSRFEACMYFVPDVVQQLPLRRRHETRIWEYDLVEWRGLSERRKRLHSGGGGCARKGNALELDDSECGDRQREVVLKICAWLRPARRL
jgi:hypothetical protein